MFKLYLKNWPVYIFFLVISLLYLHNMTRDVFSGDIGDLATVGCVWGVAHPSGYPLFTLINNLLCRLPLPLPAVTKLTLLSVFVSVLGLYLFHKLAYRFSKSLFISLLSTSILALSYLFWVHVEIPEVFALNNFFTIAILYFAIMFSEEKKLTYLYTTAFLCGLAVTHHHTIIFVFPAVLILVLRHWRMIFIKKTRTLLISILLALAGLIPYIYIPIAASHNPPINWDSVSNLRNFLHLFLRTDYGVAPSLIEPQIPTSVKFIQLADFFKSLVQIFSYQIIFVAVLGFIYLIRYRSRLLIALFISFVLAGPFFVFYAANVITTVQAWAVVERFYTMATVIFMFFVPFGLILIKKIIGLVFKKEAMVLVLLSYFILIPILLLRYNFPNTDLSRTQIGNTLASNILNSLPPDSLLFLSGDTTTFNTWYAHYVLGMRKDITIIQQPTVGGNYFLDAQINAYHKKNPQVPQKELFNKTMAEILQTKRVFATATVHSLPPGYDWIPTGYLVEAFDIHKIPDEKTYLSYLETNLKKIKPQRREKLTLAEENLTTIEIPLIYSNAFLRIGDFLINRYQDYFEAEHYYRRALWIDPDNPEGYAGLSTVQLRAYNDCKNAIANRKTAIELYPIWTPYYKQLHYIYTQCKVDKKTIIDLEQMYKQKFNADINKNQ